MRIRLLLAMLAAAGPAQAQAVKSDALPPDTLIVMQKGACEARCPVYRVMMFADGTVIFEGRHFVRHAGLAGSKIPLEDAGRLLDRVKAAGFFDLRDSYGFDESGACGSVDPDAPAVILTIVIDGKSKTIRHHRGCSGAEAARLTGLEDAIDAAAATKQWIK